MVSSICQAENRFLVVCRNNVFKIPTVFPDAILIYLF